MAIYARLENGTYAEVTGVYKTDGTEVTEIFQGDRLVYSASSEIYGSLPLYYNGKGYDLTDYLISGDTVQDGTPTPEEPVDVQGCGVWVEALHSFKLPLTVNGVERPIYLGQVESTRRIRKLVLTGEENWTLRKSPSWFTIEPWPFPSYYRSGTNRGETSLICNSFIAEANNNLPGDISDGRIVFRSNATPSVTVHDSGRTTVEQFKSYLASQYAAGTPVTVWYVLAESETGIVNEPLMKIGDYADTVSFAQAGVTIPTVSGANVLDMTSPVKPSEVYIKGKGIKPTDYGQLTDVNGVNILDKDGRPIYVHGQ